MADTLSALDGALGSGVTGSGIFGAGNPSFSMAGNGIGGRATIAIPITSGQNSDFPAIAISASRVGRWLDQHHSSTTFGAGIRFSF